MRIHNLLNINKTFLRAQFTFGVSLLITLIHIDNCCATTISQSLTNKSCQESLIPQHMEELANNMANLYLELFHRPTSSFTELSPESEASNQALWNDKLFEVETDWPGITMLIKSNVNKLLPDYLKVTYTQLNSEKNQKAIDENLLNEFEIEDRKWNICRRTQQVQDEITKQLGKSCHEITKDDLLKITKLDLSSKNISNLYQYDFWGLTHLNKLKLQNNQLETLHPLQFQNLNNLEVLDLSYNKFISYSEMQFQNLLNLSRLYLNNNLIKSFYEFQFRGLINLNGLYINNNEIENLHKNQFHDLTNLQTLKINNNNLQNLPEKLFHNLYQLLWLYLNDNQIESLHKNHLQGLVNLRWLHLQKNQLNHLDKLLFKELFKIEAIYLQNNQLKGLHKFQFNGLIKLITLYVSGNPLDDKTKDWIKKKLVKKIKDLSYEIP